MLSEARFEFHPKSKHEKPENSTPPTLYYTTKVLGKLTEINLLLPINCWWRSLPLFPNFSNEHISLWNKTQHLQNLHVKTCKHYLHQCFFKTVFLDSAINTKFSSLWYFGRLRYFSLIGLIGKKTHEIQIARPPFQKQSDFFVV